MTIIRLEPRRGATVGNRSREVRVERETAQAWYGRPLSRPESPPLEWPKAEWKQREETGETESRP